MTNPQRAGQPARTTPRRLTIIFCGVLIGTISLALLQVYSRLESPHYTDFTGIWSWARFIVERAPATIYDHATQHAFLLAVAPGFPVPMPFPYPPPYILMIMPLGHLAFGTAYVAWIGTTLLAYLAALCLWRPRLPVAVLALVAPATLVNLYYGQNGFLTAALLVGGFGLAPSSPILAGILLGLLSYKPQFGLLVAVALVAGGMWRPAIAAAATVVTLVAASLLALGLEPWMAWLRAMPDFMAVLDAQRARLLFLMPTAFANALSFGAEERTASIIQTLATLAAATSVGIAFRRGAGRLPVATIAVAALLASPYAFVYDLTLVAAAVILFAVERRAELGSAEILILAGVLLVPFAMILQLVPPVAAAAHALLIAMIFTHLRKGPAGPSAGSGKVFPDGASAER